MKQSIFVKKDETPPVCKLTGFELAEHVKTARTRKKPLSQKIAISGICRMEKERVNRAEHEYTVRRYAYGVAIIGSVRSKEFFALAKAWDDEFSILDGKIGERLRASFVFTTPDNSEKWRKELGIE